MNNGLIVSYKIEKNFTYKDDFIKTNNSTYDFFK